MSLNREFLIWKERGGERERERERERGGRAGQQAVILKVRLCSVWERQRGETVKKRQRGESEIKRQRDLETKRQRDRAENKNAEQSRVAQLVHNKDAQCVTLKKYLAFAKQIIFTE